MSLTPEIVVDLDALRGNVERLGQLVATDSDGPAVMVVVKADGYGHGIVESARAARAAGAPWLGVATQAEALTLRAAGDIGRVLCWLGVPGEEYDDAVAADVDLSASSTDQLDAIVRAAGAAGRAARVHLKVDTGLSRNGAPRVLWDDLFAAAARAQADGRVTVVGIWSHLACSDLPGHPATERQVAAFEDALELAAQHDLEPELRHLANSAGALLSPETWYDLVRIGIAAYGLSPAPDVVTSEELGLVPAMSVRAPVVLAKTIGPGDGVSYGHTFVANRRQHLALVPLGYGDGIPRHASNRAEVRIGEAHCRILGRVCMDQFVVSVPDSVVAGEEVLLFGDGADGGPTAQDWATACETISYEIVTRMGGSSGRAVRRYVGGDA